jgi:predicted transcriptional regulator
MSRKGSKLSPPRSEKIIVDILDKYCSIYSKYIPGRFNMSKALSLKINEDIYREVEKITKKYHIPRNAYINQALSVYNRLNRRKILKKQLAFESGLVGNNSLEVLAEFDKFEDEILE